MASRDTVPSDEKQTSANGTPPRPSTDVRVVADENRRGLGPDGQPRGTVPMSAMVAPGSTHARFMPPDFSISMRSGYGTNTPDTQRAAHQRQPMRGFDPTYTDIVDYILRDTSRIWDDQDVGWIYDTYAPGCRVYDDNGMKYGVERVVYETMQSINAFPDTRHYADDVIWAGDDDQGYATSHRAVNVGHHTGPWKWGPPTGRKIHTWVIANCVTRDNAIFEEWVLYNTAARLAQLGIDVKAAAKIAGNEKIAVPLTDQQSTEVERLIGGRNPEPYPANDRKGTGLDVDHTVRALFHNVYNRRNLAAIDDVYAPNVRWNAASNRSGYGRAEVRGLARSLLSTFPDLGFSVDEVYWMGNDTDGFAASVRWTATGTHRGYGLYGTPTGRRVLIWGISQLYFAGGKIVEDWTLFNEFDVLSQILRDDAPNLLG